MYPPDGGMAVADATTRAAAKRAVAGLRADGGTAIGQWLHLARETFEAYPARLRHAILLTDGENQHRDPRAARLGGPAVRRCLRAATARGVGTDWRVSELRTISEALLGTVDIVPDPSGLEADFAAMTESAMGKQVADVALRVWTPPEGATVTFVKQVAPTVDDLTGRRMSSGPASPVTIPPGRGGPARAATITSASRSHQARSGRKGLPRG